MVQVLMNTAMVAALLVGTLYSMTAESKKRTRLIIISAVAALFVGLAFYGYGFTVVCVSSGDAVFRALLAVCKMFVGKNELEAVKSVPIFGNGFMLTLFWIGHFLAFFSTSSTAIGALGSRMIRIIRTGKLRSGSLVLVYGSNAHAVEYAAHQIEDHHKTVLFVDEECNAAQADTIADLGTLVDCAADAIRPNASFLKRISIKPGDRRIELALLQDSPLRNLAYARQMLAALEEAGIQPQQTGVMLRGIDEADAESLQGTPDRYGYGSVYVFSEHELAARQMIRKQPPCEVIRFDEQGRALDDFKAVIVGFGRSGRAALDYLVMNGQFEGSHFSVDVFDPAIPGGVMQESELPRQYDIRFHLCSTESSEFYDHLRWNGCNYLVLATGNDDSNFILENSLRKWFRTTGSCPVILLVSVSGVIRVINGDYDLEYRSLYTGDALELQDMDRVAMEINQRYHADNGKTAAENWLTCDYFSRNSCRAAADFYGAPLRAAGKTVEQVMAGDWHVSGELLENLSKTEHKRWCAFHFVKGFRTMSDSVFDERAARHLAEKQQKGSSSVRPGKDLQHLLHACLVPWDDLDALSDKENAVTGKHADFKQMDRENILVIPDVLRAASAK